ncbi:MAG: hypothetical protein AAF772_02450, partial [Acidobacteriota bacterium]
DENAPTGFEAYSTRLKEDERARLGDWNAVTRVAGALGSGAAIRIANHQPDPNRLTQEANIPAIALQYLKQIVLSGGLVSCRDCAVETGGTIRDTTELTQKMSFPVEGPADSLCGMYKPALRGGDQLMVTSAVFDGDEVLGGTTLGNVAQALRSLADDGWIKFKIPIFRRAGMEDRTVDSAAVQMHILPAGGLGAAATGGFGHPESKADVDKVHFCAGFDLQIADADALGGAIVPDSKEEIGAMTWVDLDNDDRDAHFDRDDAEGVEDGDDELSQLVLQLPSGATGTVKLEATQGRGRVALWTARTKNSASERYTDEGSALTLPADFVDNGAFLQKVLYVEGIEASQGASDVVFELTYTPENTATKPVTDRVALTVLAVDDLTWRGKRNGENDDDVLGCDPNHELHNDVTRASVPADDAVTCTHKHKTDEGDRPVRVFPGKRYENGEASLLKRSEVTLEVALNVKPPRPVTLHLRSFDVDDPSASGDKVDGETGVDDNRMSGPTARGRFVDGEGDRLALEITETKTPTPFEVGMQPGDNYRVATSGDRDLLDDVANDDTQLPEADRGRLIEENVFARGGAAADAELRDAPAWVSDTLTVWRNLWVERDSMENIRGSVLTGTIEAVRPVSGTNCPTTALELDTDLDILNARDPSACGDHGVWHTYYGGRLRALGTEFTVVGSTAYGAPRDVITICDSTNALPTVALQQSLKDKTFGLRDDDFRPVKIQRLLPGTLKEVALPEGASLPLPPVDRLMPGEHDAYAPAYVRARLLEEAGGSKPGSVPLLTNLEKDDRAYVRGLFTAFKQAAHEDDPNLWTVYLLAGLQGVHWEDAEGIHCRPGEASCTCLGKRYTEGRAGGVAGEADGPGGHGAMIYWGSGSELERDKSKDEHGKPVNPEGWRLIDTVAHEIGHLFGGVHEDTGLMGDATHGPMTKDFTDVTLARIRSAKHP